MLSLMRCLLCFQVGNWFLLLSVLGTIITIGFRFHHYMSQINKQPTPPPSSPLHLLTSSMFSSSEVDSGVGQGFSNPVYELHQEDLEDEGFVIVDYKKKVLWEDEVTQVVAEETKSEVTTTPAASKWQNVMRKINNHVTPDQASANTSSRQHLSPYFTQDTDDSSSQSSEEENNESDPRTSLNLSLNCHEVSHQSSSSSSSSESDSEDNTDILQDSSQKCSQNSIPIDMTKNITQERSDDALSIHSKSSIPSEPLVQNKGDTSEPSDNTQELPSGSLTDTDSDPLAGLGHKKPSAISETLAHSEPGIQSSADHHNSAPPKDQPTSSATSAPLGSMEEAISASSKSTIHDTPDHPLSQDKLILLDPLREATDSVPCNSSGAQSVKEEGKESERAEVRVGGRRLLRDETVECGGDEQRSLMEMMGYTNRLHQSSS